jgi:riboflavin biosynthesis pyrimidine reductase
VSPAEFERLEGGGAGTAREWLAEVRPHERAGDDRPFVFANFVSTLDGRAAIAGSTKQLGTPADLEMLLELRCLADAVLVGPGTIRAEGYGRLVRSEERRAYREAHGLAPDPLLLTVSRGGDAPPADDVLPGDALAEALAGLRRRGVRSLLCEGGPRLFGSLVADGLVDELFLTLAPLLTGEDGAPRVIEGGDLPEHARGELRWVLRAGGELFLRYAL